VPEPLSLILQRAELDPPLFEHRELRSSLGAVADTFARLGILQEGTSAGSLTCPECGDHRCRVEFLVDDATSKRHGYLSCPDCGVLEVDLDCLKHWRVSVIALTEEFARAASASGRLQELVPRQLWYIGRVRWAGRQWDVCFTVCRSPGMHPKTADAVRGRPKHLLFVPTETAADYWNATAGPVFALERYLFLDGESLGFDAQAVEDRLVGLGLGTDGPKRPAKRKRASRTANIEKLTQALMEHVRTARKAAFDARDRTGTPDLLPRPKIGELAKQTGMSSSTVSRCLKDPEARELQFLWDLAVDLDRLMGWEPK